MALNLNAQQKDAILKAETWWERKRGEQQVFHLTGEAGTGKTTVFEEVLKALGIEEETALVAPTWKAARVLQHRSGRKVTSIHALMYLPKADALSELRRALAEEIASSTPCEEAIAALQEQMTELQSDSKDVEFVLNPLINERTQNYRAIGCDEGSMVGSDVGRDMEQVGLPLILMYDPFQLAPVKATFAWEGVEADVHLTEIMRTGAGSGVAYAARDIRNGRELRSYGEDFTLLSKGKLSYKDYAENFDMVVVGTNALRRNMNDGMRKALDLPPYPVIGDRIISLSNNDVGISNGEIFTIEKINQMTPRVINMDIVDNFGNRFRHVRTWREIFDDDSLGYRAPFGMCQFTYAYAITAHKAQGSEAARVCVLDSWKGGDYLRWLYTAVTRASKTCTLVR